jgi:hypothetical protein
MIEKLLALGLGLSMLCAAEISIKRPAQVVHTERVDFASGGTIRLNDSFGDLYIEGWDQPAVEMTLIREMMEYDVPKGVSERLDRILFTTEHPSANELLIGTTVPSRSFFRHPFGGKGDVSVRYELRIPRESHVAIRHAGGNILIDNVTGGVDATNRDGDIILMLPGPGPYSIDAKSTMGTVISDFAGKAHVRHFIGEAFSGANESPAHSIHLRVGFGGITIKEMPPEARP